MNTTQPIQILGRWLALSVAVVLLSGCELPSPDTVQHGYRGTGMVQVYNTRLLAAKVDANVPPVAIPGFPVGLTNTFPSGVAMRVRWPLRMT